MNAYNEKDSLLNELGLLEDLRLSLYRRAKLPGLIFIPEEFQVIDKEEYEDIAVELSDVMCEVATSTDHLGNVVPIVIKGPADLIGKVKHVKLDEGITELLENVEKRIEIVKDRLKAYGELT